MVRLWMRRMVRLELVLIFLVILAGSVVRMTGSGMGCPDWPKCFGYLIPPTESEQVQWAPDREYQKGQFIVHEEALFSAVASFTSGESYQPENWEKYTVHDYALFNPTHTWVEYINRLLGAASGVPMLLLFFLSMLRLRSEPLLFLLSAAGLFMLGFEAWLGKEVVDGHLIPHQITYHMMGAFAIVVILVVLLSRLSPALKPMGNKALIGIALVLMLVQVVLGTQVREQVDALTKSFGDSASREGWVSQIDAVLYIHRSASLLVGALVAFLWWRVKKSLEVVPAFMNGAFVMVLVSILSGAILFYFDLPRFLQPVHLLLSAGIVATLTWGLVRDWGRTA